MGPTKDNTTGTSEVDDFEDRDPDDCYCESATDKDLNCISYAMGVDDSIYDLKKDGFEITEDDGDYKVRFNSDKASIWEKYIMDHIQDTYWNEYINLDDHEINFMIKENGQIERYINSGFNENPKLLAICNRLCEGDFKTMKDLLLSNDFYKSYIEDWDKDMKQMSESYVPLSEFDQYFQEYTSSKQRNRQKKFLEEKNFVPDKDNPKKGTIDSTEIDPKTGKPIRVKFSYDNEKMNNRMANASGTDFIHMNERILKQHPDVSRGTFAHEDGHLIKNRNPEKFTAEVEKICKKLKLSGLESNMNCHGNSPDEYIADKNSLDKVGYNATVRMLKKAYEPKDIGYDKQRKAIRKDPYGFIVNSLSYDAKETAETIGAAGLELIGFMSTDRMYQRAIKFNKDQINREISFKRQLIQDKKYNDRIEEYISHSIDRCKENIADLEEKIKESKEKRQKLREELINNAQNIKPDKNALIKELLDGIDELEKANNVERDFRIKMLSFWNKGDDTVNESYIPLSEFDHFFQEAKLKSKARKELDDSDFALVYKDASGNKIRKYPINDEAHVKAAARMFPRGVPNKYRKEVAGKILRRAHKFGIDTEGWKSLNNAANKE